MKTKSASKPLTNCVGGFPSSFTINVCLTALPSALYIKSLALASAALAAPIFIMLSIRDLGFAPASSYDCGRGFRRALIPSMSLWNRPRGRRGRSSWLCCDEPECTLSSSGGKCPPWDGGVPTSAPPETLRGNGTGSSSLAGEPGTGESSESVRGM